MNDLDPIHEARRHVAAAESKLEDAVLKAHDAGYSWAQIGKELGISRQAAFKRFGKITNPFSGEVMQARTTDHLPALSEKFIRHLQAGQEDPTISMLHHGVRAELNWGLLSETWERIIADTGELEKVDDAYVTHPKGKRGQGDAISNTACSLTSKMLGTVVVVSTMHFAAGELMARVAFDKDDAIIGVLFLPLDSQNFPF